ncbi:LPS translocon maturation chaperone LptM [Marilutibacter chinensis]|uniref:Lipoprotein n=1 Tax=Marilutibacter chinensis TaxID=2912247 RepID=A0ABS9HRE2_9GAMM|nr:lipoprotein [Lysobacter chinensis]MCF7221515.1 lipoprotein [Lysobacter chinensis]
MNARIALPLILLSLALAACGNKGPLVQAPVEMPVGTPADTTPADAAPTDAGTPPADDVMPEAEGDGDEEPAAG